MTDLVSVECGAIDSAPIRIGETDTVPTTGALLTGWDVVAAKSGIKRPPSERQMLQQALLPS